MSDLVSVDGAWKRYLLGQGRGALGVLRSMARAPGRDTLWALQDVTFNLQAGDSLGVIGRNGAGKTTLLKLIAGISRTTRGNVVTQGRVASLLNVGAGFHRELTGRENVLLNAVILGLTRKEAQRRYEQIVEFAGIAPFMDTPVKQFSSGMYARLAFSVAAHAEPDVLLVDEVLSVGDAAFQDRSLRRMLDFRDRRRAAVMFVSHNLSAVELMCERAMWLERGVVRAIGPTSEVIRAYLDDTDESADTEAVLEIDSVDVVDSLAEVGERSLTVHIRGAALRDLAEPVFVVTIRGDHGPLFAGNMHIDGNWPARLPKGPFALDCEFKDVTLPAGRYRVELKVKQNVRTNYYEPRVKASFVVHGDGELVRSTWQLRQPSDERAIIGGC